MAAKEKRIEVLMPQVAAGKVTLHGDSVKYTRSSDGKHLILPAECLSALTHFMAGKSIKRFVIETYQKGLRVDFVALKHTLYSLYWSHNLLNENEFRRAIETSDWMPVSDSHILNPIAEISIAGEGFGTQALIFSIVIAVLFVAARLVAQPENILFALLIFPGAFLNVKGVASAAISAIFNLAPQNLNLHLSLLGLYVRESSEKRRHITNYEYVFHSLTTLGLAAASIFYFVQNEDPTIARVGVAGALLLASVLHSPAHRTDLSNLFISVEGGVTAKSSSLYILGVLTYALTAGAFLFLALLDFIFVFSHHEELNLYPHIVLLVLTGGFFIDLLDNFDFIFDQISGRFVAPIKSTFSGFLQRKAGVDIAKTFKAIPLFKTLPESILSEMAHSSKMVQVRAGVTICKTGQTTTDLFVIISGRIGIYHARPDGKQAKILDLEDGGVFGEGSFFLNRPRNGDAVTLTPTTILCVKRPKEFDQAESREGKVDNAFQRKIWSFQALANSKMFKDVPAELVMQIVSKGNVVEMAEKTLIMNRGDVPDSLWVTIQGQCRASATGHNALINAGDVFGEIGIIWNSRRTSTVTTVTAVVLLRVEAIDVWALLSNCFDLGVSLQELGQQRLLADAA